MKKRAVEIAVEPVPNESSNIAGTGHHGDSKTLRVEFHGGAVYDYSGVPAEKHAAMRAAKSHGEYFHKHIRGKFPFVKVA